MSAGAVSRSLDVDILRERPRRRDLRAFWKAFSRDYPQVRDVRGRARRAVFTGGAVVGGIGLLAMVLGLTSEIRRNGVSEPDQLAGMGVMTVLFAIALGVLLWAAVRTASRRSRPREHWLLSRFAERNGMFYLPGPLAGGLRVWQGRGALTVARAVRARTTTGRPVEWADYELRYSTAGSTHTQFGGWIAIRLRRPLPHIVLRSTSRGARAFSAAAVPASAQRLSLEGDFDRHAELFCPAGYERDALYLFTPDVMERVVEGANGWDIEIIDDIVTLVRSRDVVTTDPAVWVDVVRAAQIFAGKLEQWERWSDDRVVDAVDEEGLGLAVGDGAVAAPGRRLRMRWATSTWVWLAVAVAIIVTILVLGQL